MNLKNSYLLPTLLFFASTYGSDDSIPKKATIEFYDHARDAKAVSSIIEKTAETLCMSPMTTEDLMKYVESKNYQTKVMRVDGSTIGFINYVDTTRSFLTFNIPFLNYHYINAFAIDPGFQKKGYGSHFLSSVTSEIEQQQKTKGIRLNVKTDNIPARCLYKKVGFEPMAESPLFCSMVKESDVPASELPQGNIIQRHPKTALALLGIAVVCRSRILDVVKSALKNVRKE